MKCPHCNVTVHLSEQRINVIDSIDEAKKRIRWITFAGNCPACAQAVIHLAKISLIAQTNGVAEQGVQARYLAWPTSGSRPCPPHVPTDLKTDFDEAVVVLSLSPQGSAALTRRALQQVLRDHGHTQAKDLFDQIQETIDSNLLPTHLADQLNAVRVIGNFAAHPLKSKNTGLILPVEDHEAEWNLDVLEGVFDHYFVKPAQAQARKDALNRKLAEAGKPTI